MNELDNQNLFTRMPRFDEEHRRQCEVRFWLKLRKEKGLKEFRSLISDFDMGKKRPAVMKDMQEQWAKGSCGNFGDWF